MRREVMGNTLVQKARTQNPRLKVALEVGTACLSLNQLQKKKKEKKEKKIARKQSARPYAFLTPHM